MTYADNCRTWVTKASLDDEWTKLSGDALCGQPEILDQIAWVLSVYKDDDEVRAELTRLALPNRDALIDTLLNIRFDKFHALSLKALRAIVPYMEKGLRYDEACVEAGYHHSQLHKIGEGEHKYLPPLYAGRDKDGRMRFTEDTDIPRNPVVLRSLNQARKVVNAIIRRYGSPTAVHIEMARDLTKPLKGHWNSQGKFIEGRQDIQKEQLEFQKVQTLGAAIARERQDGGQVKLSTFIPLKIRKRGGSKVVVRPDGQLNAPGKVATQIDQPLLVAVTRAFYWQQLLDDGVVGSGSEIAKAEGLHHSTVNELLRLTLLEPVIIQTILAGQQPRCMSLLWFQRNPLPTDWRAQREVVAGFDA